jgi:Rrf2 family protein
VISHKAIIAIRAILAVARHGAGRPIHIKKISEVTGVSAKYLQVILIELKCAGLLQSTRGPQGGYQLARSAAEISFLDVVRVTDGSLALAPCFGLAKLRQCSGCYKREHCIIRKSLAPASGAAETALSLFHLKARAASAISGAKFVSSDTQ